MFGSASLFAENNLKFNHITVMDGLLNNSATSIAQDSVGFIWIATLRGLNRFDGYKVDAYLNQTDLCSTVYSNRIRKIVIENNNIWLVTHSGLQCFDIQHKKYVLFKEKTHIGLASRQSIKNLFIDTNRRMWIVTRNKLECALITNTKNGIELIPVQINQKPKLKLIGLVPTEVTELSNGTVILNYDGNLFRLQSPNNDLKKIVTIPLKLPNIAINNIKANGNNLWLFTKKNALGFRIENDNLIPFDNISLPVSNFQYVNFSKNYMWVVTTQGLFRINMMSEKHEMSSLPHTLDDPYSVSNDHQSGLFIDNKNNLWVTTWSAGVSYANVDKQKFNLVRYLAVKSNKYLPSEFVYSIHEDNKGHIYVGTKFGGISRFNVQTQTFDYTINLKEKINQNALVPCIVSDDRWIYAVVTTVGSTIYRFDKMNLKMELVKSYNPSTVFSLGFDTHQQLWVGVIGQGLSCIKFDRGKVISEKLYTIDQDPVLNLTSNVVNYVFNDKQKNEVLISTDNGLNRLMLDKNGNVESIAYYLANVENPHTLSSNYLWPIDKENDSTYWIGTLGSGLNRITINKRVKGTADYKAERFGTKEGAPSENIESVQVDKFGNVWCGGLYLSRFNYKTKKFKTFYEEDGLQSYLFGTGTSCITRSGMLFFGGLKGMNYFIPDTISTKKTYKIVFSRISINGKKIEVGDTINSKVVMESDLMYGSDIKLAYPCNNLKIDFTSLAFSQRKNIQYRYKLLGFDKEWNYTNGENAYALYPKLPYKSYKLIVEVSDDNEWYSSESTLEFTILPPWWRSVWAYLIYFIIISVIAFIIARYSYNWVTMKRRIVLQEEREKQNEELMELKMNFFTNISHEFKTPLTLINAALSEIEAQVKSLTENKYFQTVKRNNSKLLHLIIELLDFQRSDAALTELKTTRIDIKEFVKDLFYEFSTLSEKSEIEMKLSLPLSTVEAWVDEECLTKILSNILSNSIRYTNKGGTISVKLEINDIANYAAKFNNKVVLLDGIQAGNQFVVSVVDTGVGISSDSLPKVFERFYTINSKTSKHLGSGIGLAFVKSLVKLHKGGIIMSSERNIGTEFVFSIPLESDYLKVEQKIAKAEFDRKLYLENNKIDLHNVKIDFTPTFDEAKPTILIVDDNQEILMILREHFKDEFNSILAENGEEGLNLCKKYQPDIIISDVMMPIMDGLELCKRVKSQLSTCFIPFILLSARGSVEQQMEGLDEGADAYIPKPFHLGVLHSTVKNLINRASLINQQHNKSGDPEVDVTTTSLSKNIDSENQKFLDKLKHLIESNLENSDFSVDDLSLEIGISRSRLYAQMKLITNETLGEFIREIRLQKAAELLRYTSLSIKEVGFKIGFDNPPSFTRFFKDRFGITPSEYVKNKK